MLLAPRFALCSNFFVYFCRDGSRVCSRNSHSSVLVTGRASTPPHPGTRAPPGARGLHCPIVFTPAQSCFLFLSSCPHCVLCRSPWKKTSSFPCPEESMWARASAPSPWPRTPLILASGEKFRYSVIIPLPLSAVSPLLRLRGRLRGEPPHFSRLRESARQPLHGIGTRRLFRGRKHLLQAGRRLPCHSAPPVPSPADRPTFPRRPAGGYAEAPLGRPQGPGKRRRAPHRRPPRRAGVQKRPPQEMRFQRGSRRGACPL